MFFGKVTIPLNEKSKPALPSGFHQAMSRTAYITRGFDQNLYLLPQDTFNIISSHMRMTSITDPLSRLLKRLFLGSAVEIIVSADGQFEIPTDMCTYAGLDREIILVGQGDYLEIWSPPSWQKQMESLDDPEANMDRFSKFTLAMI